MAWLIVVPLWLILKVRLKLAEIQDNSIGRNADELLRKVEAAQFVAGHDGGSLSRKVEKRCRDSETEH